MKKIRVCVLMPSHWSGRKGGAELQAKYISEFLLNKGNFEIYFICRNFSQSFGEEIVYTVPKNYFSKYSYVFDRFAVLRHLKAIKPDYIYQRVLCSYTGFAAKYCKRNEAKMIFHIASPPDVEPYRIRFNRNLIFGCIERHYRKYGLINADFIIAQSNDQNELLEKHFSRQCDLIMPNISNDVSALGRIKPSKRLKVLWVSNLKPNKCPEKYISLAENFLGHKDLEFHMAGKVTSNYARNIEKQARQLNNMVFHGEIPLSKVNELMAESLVFVNTSIVEGFPNTFIQAWMNETPVLSVNVDPDGIIESHGLGKRCDSLARMTEILDEWAQNTSDIQEQGRKCRDFALSYFSMNNANSICQLIYDDYWKSQDAEDNLISVIITAYNEEKYIERAIRSVLAQTHEGVEIIVIDDGSTDRTHELCRRSLPDIKIYRNHKSIGLMAARNLGVQRATGKYVAFLDGDDEFSPEKLSIQLKALRNLPDKSMLFCGRIVYSECGVPRIPIYDDISGRLKSFSYNDVLQKRVSSLGATFMMRLRDYKKLGNMDIVVGKERGFIARFSFSGGELYRLCLPLYIQHRKPNSMSTRKELTYMREIKMLEAWRPSENRHPDRNISEMDFRDYECSVHISYKKQFSESLIAQGVDDSFRASFEVRLYRFILQRTKTIMKELIGRLTYLRYKMGRLNILSISSPLKKG